MAMDILRLSPENGMVELHKRQKLALRQKLRQKLALALRSL